MRPRVLILSSLYDFSTDLVVLRLRESHIPFLRLNREQIADYRLSMDPVQQILVVRGADVDTVIGPDLQSVWFRQPVFLRNTPGDALTPEQQLERSQWAAFLRALSIFDAVAWMNFPQATYLAECKPYQLLVAHRCGFRVPRSIVGNDAQAIASAFQMGMVVKSLDTVLLREGSDCLFTYTTIAEPDTLSDEEVGPVPLIAQQLLSGKTDIRVTVVGETMFAVRILSDGKGVEGDWRVIPKHRLTYESLDLPPDIETACSALARHLGLSFAAIDLLETSTGIVFIEVNPTGEWGWISGRERPIDTAIANWLSSPNVVMGLR
ncbi:RimK-like protein [Candidatus Methylomirabilis sp.]|uniref:RimK-like protein n=1 Tax=Candidatus Methylomirabilis sp. TaxID=2032687 RepID=UPI003C7148F1